MAKKSSPNYNPDSLLADFIAECFSLDELKSDICLRCDIDFEELPGSTKSGKIYELILYFKRRGLTVERLLPALQNSRSHIQWKELIQTNASGFRQTIPTWLFGKWQGEWEWRGQERHADLLIDNGKSVLRIKYRKREALTIVEQQMKVVEVGDWIFLVGVDYEFIEQGEAAGYYLDSFQLHANTRRTCLSGIKTDSREIPSEVWFKKQKPS